MPDSDDFLDRLSPDDPYYELAKRFHHEAWADSYDLEADAAAGRATLSDFVDRCVHLFEHAAQTLGEIRDDIAVQAQCNKLDELAREFIGMVNEEIASNSERLGEVDAAAAIDDVSRRVLEISALSKKQIHQRALADIVGASAAAASPSISAIKGFERWIQPVKVRLRRKLISPEEALKELRAIADDGQCPPKIRANILEELDALSTPAPDFEDSAVDGLRAALSQNSEKIRREAVAMILDRIMAPPAIRDYVAAKRYAERIGAIRGRTVSSVTEPSESSHASSETLRDQTEAKSAPNRSEVAIPARQATPKRMVDRARVDHKIRSYEKIAARIGISKDTLHAITKETRWVSDLTYDLVAVFCRCKPEDLHPSGIPSRK